MSNLKSHAMNEHINIGENKMITLRDFMEVTDYKITEGSDFLWNCYGPTVHSLDSWNQSQVGHTVHVVFDTTSQEVYEMSVCDYSKNLAYRWINPEYIKDYLDEAKSKGINPYVAYDEVNYIDLEVTEDLLEKARAIVAGEEYDTRVCIQIRFTDEELLTYMKLAHELDITFNQFVVKALEEMLDKHNIPMTW